MEFVCSSAGPELKMHTARNRHVHIYFCLMICSVPEIFTFGDDEKIMIVLSLSSSCGILGIFI